MKKGMILGLLLLLLLILGFGQKAEKIDKAKEDGIEVILNHHKPYVLVGSPFNPRIEQELVIDLEDSKVTETGLYDIQTFGIDSERNIYVVSAETETDHVFKFTSQGHFVKSFGKHGQGPGELSRPVFLSVADDDKLYVSDAANGRYMIFDTSGNLIKEQKFSTMLSVVHPLSNGKFITFGVLMPEENQDYMEYPLNLCSTELKAEKRLEGFRLENPRVTRRIRGVQPGFGFTVSKDLIFSGNENRGYDIRVYDFEGHLIRKIKKEFKPISISEDQKKKALDGMNKALRQFAYFPKCFPPFRSLFADEQGRLFVVTYEPGAKGGDHKVDVFNQEGAFIGKINLNIFHGNTPQSALIKSGILYYAQEKDNGYKQLTVAKLNLN